MGKFQEVLTAVLPQPWAAAMEAESRGWAMRCACGHETTIWDMGGVRFKAAGQPKRIGRCAACGATFFGDVYRTSQGPPQRSTAPTIMDQTTMSGTRQNPSDRSQCLLWIDGVGCWLVCLKDRISIGGPTFPGTRGAAADIRLLADLSRLHAVFGRSGESYVLEANGLAAVSGRKLEQPALLRDGDIVELGAAVKLRFRQPSGLSPTARLEFFSDHRPARRIDGIILLDELCLLGPGPDCHVPCPEWEQTVVMFRRHGKLWCKSSEELYVNGGRAAGDSPVRDGTVVTGKELRFRAEFSHADLG
jgi:hypothetical protein